MSLYMAGVVSRVSRSDSSNEEPFCVSLRGIGDIVMFAMRRCRHVFPASDSVSAEAAAAWINQQIAVWRLGRVFVVAWPVLV